MWTINDSLAVAAARPHQASIHRSASPTSRSLAYTRGLHREREKVNRAEAGLHKQLLTVRNRETVCVLSIEDPGNTGGAPGDRNRRRARRRRCGSLLRSTKVVAAVKQPPGARVGSKLVIRNLIQVR